MLITIERQATARCLLDRVNALSVLTVTATSDRNFLVKLPGSRLKCSSKTKRTKYWTIQYDKNFALKNWPRSCQFNPAHKL